MLAVDVWFRRSSFSRPVLLKTECKQAHIKPLTFQETELQGLFQIIIIVIAGTRTIKLSKSAWIKPGFLFSP